MTSFSLTNQLTISQCIKITLAKVTIATLVNVSLFGCAANNTTTVEYTEKGLEPVLTDTFGYSSEFSQPLDTSEPAFTSISMAASSSVSTSSSSSESACGAKPSMTTGACSPALMAYEQCLCQSRGGVFTRMDNQYGLAWQCSGPGSSHNGCSTQYDTHCLCIGK